MADGDNFTELPIPDNAGIKYADTSVTDGGVADGTRVQRVKLGVGGSHEHRDVSEADPLPATNQDTEDTQDAILRELKLQTMMLESVLETGLTSEDLPEE